MVHATFFDGRTAQGQDVALTLTDTGLTIATPNGLPMAIWAFAGLVRTNRDAPGGTVTLLCKRRQQRLEVTDPALVDALARRGFGPGAPTRWSIRRYAAFCAALAAAVAFAALLTNDLPALLVPLVPRSLERGWSATIEGVLTAGQTRCTAPAGRAALTTLLARLARAADVSPVPHLTVLNDAQTNAFTLPDGRILVLRGLLDTAQDPDELSGVLAHELGHVKHRDPTREALRGIGLGMLVRTMGWGGNLAGQMAALSYGRRAEAAADDSALHTLRTAGMRTDGLSRFFTLLHARPGGEGLPAFLSDHPTTQSRAERLRSDASGETALTGVEWAAVREVCGK